MGAPTVEKPIVRPPSYPPRPKLTQRRQSPLQHFGIGLGANAVEGGFYSLLALFRKIPVWERAPIIEEHIRTQTVVHALDAVKKYMEDHGEKDTNEYQEIFGEISERSTRRGVDTRYGDITYVGKGWNSLVYRFHAGDRSYVVKLGAKFSPDPKFFLNPSNPKHADELNHNLDVLQEEMNIFDLPNLIPTPQIIRHVSFRNFLHIPLNRTIHIMPEIPNETIMTLNEVAALKNSDNTALEALQTEYEQYCKLRSDLINKYNLDFDLHGRDNVVIVREGSRKGNSQLPYQYHIKVLDVGLRVQGTNRPISDLAHDFFGLLHSIQMRYAVYGEKPPTLNEILLTEDSRHITPELNITDNGLLRRWAIRFNANQARSRL